MCKQLNSWCVSILTNTPDVCVSVLLSYRLQGAFGKPSTCQPCPQFTDVKVSIFVEVQLVKQLSPALLPVLIRTGGFSILTAHPRDPSTLGSHSWMAVSQLMEHRGPHMNPQPDSQAQHSP